MKIRLGNDEYWSERTKKGRPIDGMTSVIRMNGKVVAATATGNIAEVVLLTLKRMWLIQSLAVASPEVMTVALDMLTALRPPRSKPPPKRKAKGKSKK